MYDPYPTALDEDDAYYHGGQHYRAAPSRRASHFPVLQPQEALAPMPSRNLYRDTRPRVQDDIEDDGLLYPEDNLRYDSFDRALLQQPIPDRQQQAAQGRARLSLAPGPSTFFTNPVPSQSQASYWPQDEVHNDRVEQPTRADLSRFAYNESSSDAKLGPSSSPALKAGRRRAEHAYDPPDQRVMKRHQSQYTKHDNENSRHTEYREQYTPTDWQRQQSFEDQEPDFSSYSVQNSQAVAKSHGPSRPQPMSIRLPHAPPMCQGIQLVPVSTLPDRLRTAFPYPTFNAVQSKCFDTVFRTDDNFVLSSPTGSGKTVILELAICRAIATNATGQYKIVYQAPTKALCAERQRDWQAKFTPLGLTCAELTGDTDAVDVRNVQSANIIVTTPEKWDGITRKWKDHEKLMRLIKVFLIDEVHILKEDRGAVLEAVVSRMKSFGTNVRFVALSATVPNFHDVATWLGKSSSEPSLPAVNEKFGEDFRPVKLQKHVCGYMSQASNDFGFEKVLDNKLTEVLTKYSEGKPIMIFCTTRASCTKTAKQLATWWLSRNVPDRKWEPPTRQIAVVDKDLKDTVSSGVAFHHAGLNTDDRTQVEKGFLSHNINVICCTSTLAVGVNLPCHLVVIKNTVTYTDEGLQEYSDLEMMQMLGRAGRPQFDNSAVAVIMTRSVKTRKYEMMVTGQELLESKLHSNLIDHMNAEIGLGTIRDLVSARKWLKGTFLYVRLQQNPSHYKLEGARAGQGVKEQVDDICSRDVDLLRDHNLVSGDEHYQCTDFGHAMARYYVHFDSMKVFMGIQSKASVSEILSAIAQSSELSKLRFRAGEKPFYKLLNKSPSIRFSIPVNLDLPAHKVSLIIQSVLGSADIAWDGDAAKHRNQYTLETQIVFKNVNSLIRCIIDCQICLNDSTSIHSALMLERSLGSRIWDDSPLQMKQIENIGVVGVRKFVNAGIRSMEDLEACDARRVEALINRNPPFGMKVLDAVKAFPKLRVSLHAPTSSATKCPDGVKIQVKADIGFLNETPPHRFNGRPVYVCVLAETSDGRKVHFARISGQKLGRGQSLNFSVLMNAPEQSINCYVMCDSISGSSRCATVKPQIAPSMFPVVGKAPEPTMPQRSNTSKRRAEPVKPVRKKSNTSDDFGDDGIDDDELVKVSCGDLDFEHIDNYPNPVDAITRKNTAKNDPKSNAKTQAKTGNSGSNDHDQEPVQLSNGKWACKHLCKDKNACKHLCCKEGMDKPPKKTAVAKHPAPEDDRVPATQTAPKAAPKSTQSKLQLTATKRKIPSVVEELDLTQDEKKQKKAEYTRSGPRDYRDLHQLHKSVQKKDPPSTLHSVMHNKPAYCYSQGGEHTLSFLQQPLSQQREEFSDYGDDGFSEIPSNFDMMGPDTLRGGSVEPDAGIYMDDMITNSNVRPISAHGSDTFGDEDSLLGDAMIGLADSQNLRIMNDAIAETWQSADWGESMDLGMAIQDEEFDVSMDDSAFHNSHFFEKNEILSQGSAASRQVESRKSQARAPFLDSTSTCGPAAMEDKISQPPFFPPVLKEINVGNARPSKVHLNVMKKPEMNDVEGLDLVEEMGSPPIKEEQYVPAAFEGIEPWLFQEYGDVVELID